MRVGGGAYSPRHRSAAGEDPEMGHRRNDVGRDVDGQAQARSCPLDDTRMIAMKLPKPGRNWMCPTCFLWWA